MGDCLGNCASFKGFGGDVGGFVGKFRRSSIEVSLELISESSTEGLDKCSSIQPRPPTKPSHSSLSTHRSAETHCQLIFTTDR
jgi:hypothetical protein